MTESGQAELRFFAKKRDRKVAITNHRADQRETTTTQPNNEGDAQTPHECRQMVRR